MYANLAQLGLVLSVIVSIFVPFGLFWFNRLNQRNFSRILSNIVFFQFIFVSFAFIALCYAYLVSDFSLYNVSRNSHIAVPLIYKLSGVWSNHEGSMLLWLFILNIVNVCVQSNKFSLNEKIWLNVVLIFISSSLILYTILKSNPFIKIYPIPKQGNGFNPLLQDVALAIHPPILYIGFITTVTSFAVAISVLINNKIDDHLLKVMRNWSLFSWSFLTLGVALGSWWAYRELGWGGYWFWDPVENASLLPWLSSSALIHSLYVNKKLSVNYRTTILLAILTFIFAILATFFVRSGVINSVHSFATDPNRGIFLLKLLSIYSLFGFTVFAFNVHRFSAKEQVSWISRYGGVNIGNILWVFASFIILLSLLYPLYMKIYVNKQIVVERNFFENIFIPSLLLILIAAALALPAAWKQILLIHYKHFTYSFILSAIGTILFYLFALNTPTLLLTFAFFSGLLLVIRMLFWLYQRKITSNISIKFFLILMAHLLAGLFALNLAITESSSQEKLVKMSEGETTEFMNFVIEFAKKENLAIENFLVGRAILNVKEGCNEIAVLAPEIRYYPVEKKQTSEASIYHSWLYDLYAVINESSEQGDISVKFYFKPMMSSIWIIVSLIFACGIMLLFRLPSKHASGKEFKGGSERRTGVYKGVHEDSSTELTYKLPAEVEFGKMSNFKKRLNEAHN